MKPIEVRFARLHNIVMAAVAAGMAVLALVQLSLVWGRATADGQTDSRLLLYAMLAAAMAYYAWLGFARYSNRPQQVGVDRAGVQLGFGRNRRLVWQDIDWVRVRRLGLRPQLQIGLRTEAFITSNLGLSMWSLDDALRPVRGMPTAVAVRDNGL